LLECDGISAQIHDGDELRVNLEKGLIEDVSQGLRFNAVPMPSFLMAILEKGLVDYIKSKRSE
jgi:3-isopropylmalate dehydratase small subunit